MLSVLLTLVLSKILKMKRFNREKFKSEVLSLTVMSTMKEDEPDVKEGGLQKNSLTSEWVSLSKVTGERSYRLTVEVQTGNLTENFEKGRGLRFIPDLRSSHVPLSNEVHALQLQSLCSKVHEPQLLKPLGPGARDPNKRNHCNEKAVQQENSPARYNQRKPACRDEDPVQPKVIWTITLASSQCTVFSEMDRMA
ncbi:hypothetical protein MG293_012166 [Ovis ammon polii]|uniref:Uncharacterized protein n=1 Tax=Ovis ammon polii TaxID=230172 RepID=A0AAD4TZ78_OVIAM|nr:hypothetical protein MG293_012166 [Ovis ammon polii]